MTLPSSDSGKTYWEDKTVSPGDPTEATDYNTVAGNADYLLEGKPFGWGDGTTLAGQARMNKNGTGTIWVAGTSVMNSTSNPRESAEIALVDVGDLGLPPESGGFADRMVRIDLCIVGATNGFQGSFDLEEFLPHGSLEAYLAGDPADPISGQTEGETWNPTTCSLWFWPGVGESAPPTVHRREWVFEDALLDGSNNPDFTFRFRVDPTSGNLVVQWRYDATGDHAGENGYGIVWQGTVSYGPVWTELTA
jgi:hypothetical protein